MKGRRYFVPVPQIRTDPATDATRELERAEAKFPAFNSPHEGWAVIKEELDELWEHVRGNTGYSDGAYHEACQVAAMALRYMKMVEARNGG